MIVNLDFAFPGIASTANFGKNVLECPPTVVLRVLHNHENDTHETGGLCINGGIARSSNVIFNCSWLSTASHTEPRKFQAAMTSPIRLGFCLCS